MTHNRFLSKAVRSRLIRADRAERHSDRMQLEQLRSGQPVPSREPMSKAELDALNDSMMPEGDLLAAAAELGIDLSGVEGVSDGKEG